MNVQKDAPWRTPNAGDHAIFDPALTILDCFLAQVVTRSEKTAVIEGQQRVSYEALADRASVFATILAQAGVEKGDRVGVLAGRDVDSIAAQLGILALGGVFTPLDPGNPVAHLKSVVQELAPKVIVDLSCETNLARRLLGDAGAIISRPAISRPEWRPGDDANSLATYANQNRCDAGDPAMILFTSGTTGRPKGVVLPHRAITRLVRAQHFADLGPDLVSLNAAAPAFDACIQQVCSAILNGGAVAIVPGGTPSIDAIADAALAANATIIDLTPGMFNLLVELRMDALKGVAHVICGGDVMSESHARQYMAACPKGRLINAYGPTENGVTSTFFTLDQTWTEGPAPIGRAIAHDHALVLDDNLRPIAAGEIGQLAVGGPGLAIGYFKRPALTAEKFVDVGEVGARRRVYLTGDLARDRGDGVLMFHGRVDRQVKINGHRVELDAVEHALRDDPDVADGAVLCVASPAGAKRLVAVARPAAHCVGADGEDPGEPILSRLREALPGAMVPTAIFLRDELPMTASDKIDRRRLEAELDASRNSAVSDQNSADSHNSIAEQYSDPEITAPTAIGSVVREVWSQVLGLRSAPDDRSFFDLGGTSLQLVEAHARLQVALDRKIEIARLFEKPKLKDLIAWLETDATSDANVAQKAARLTAGAGARNNPKESGVAIVGMAARIPGVADLEEFWRAVVDGRNLIEPIPHHQLEDNFTDEERARPNYVPVRPSLKDADMFDADFFGMFAREAALTDPQHRVFLEICWEAFENAGIDPTKAPGAVGVFAGASNSTYLLNNVLADRAAIDEYVSTYQLGDVARCSGAQLDSLATRVSYKLGLTGPALGLSTACATSLTAVALACDTLTAGRCDAALAGGVSISFPQARGYFHQDGGMASADGVCRPFDADANGTVFGHGAGVVLLRRLEDALADDQTIYAVIKGAGQSNDGADRMSFTAPSVAGQAKAVRAAMDAAGFEPATIGYVECHGTGTPLGDPIEIEALRQAFADGDASNGATALGAAKANIGHLDAAAGVIGVIKTALALSRRTVPPLANFRRPNPHISLDGSPFRILTKAEPWESAAPRRAGVSSFGVGGTNAHVAMEEAPTASHTHGAASDSSADSALPHILPLSARSPDALAAMSERLAKSLEAEDAPALADVALTLQDGRTAFAHRRVIVAQTAQGAIAELRKPTRPVTKGETSPPVVFMFPGQGAQYPGMGADLYREDVAFARTIDEGADLLIPILNDDIRRLMFAEGEDMAAAADALRNTSYAQPAIFLVSYALAQAWAARGVRPDALIGHSIGEFVAATLAGALDFESALTLVAARGRLMQAAPRGVMLSVRAPLDDVLTLAPEGVDLAARNAPRLNVFAGPDDAIAAYEAILTEKGAAFKRLHTSHAFHSSMMQDAAAALGAEAAKVTFAKPSMTWASCVTGGWIGTYAAQDADYWAEHCRTTVNFEKAVGAVADRFRRAVYLEVGPGQTLSAFVAQTIGKDAVAAQHASLPTHEREASDRETMARAFGCLWAAGVDIDWRLSHRAAGKRVPLPTYPFERKRHWIDAPTPTRRKAQGSPDSDQGASALPSNHITATLLEPAAAMSDTASPANSNRSVRLQGAIFQILEDVSGETFGPDDADASFLELGFDSLMLSQVVQRFSREVGVELTFRQLMADFPSVMALVAHLDDVLPPEPEPQPQPSPAPDQTTFPTAIQSAPQSPAPTPMPTPATGLAPSSPSNGVAGPMTADSQSVMHAQTQAMLALFESQLRTLQASGGAQPAEAPQAPPETIAPVAPAAHTAPTATETPSEVAPSPAPKPAGLIAPARKPVTTTNVKESGRSRLDLNRRNQQQAELTSQQRALIDEVCAEYSARFPISKERAQDHRRVLADPRTASGFRREWKELVFPVLAQRAFGAHIDDVDGNRFVDVVNGFGQTAFGHAPDFVTKAVAKQMERGFAIGPQDPLAHDVARRFAQMTEHERVTFCNTGSEAVMAAMRLARTVTGRDTIVTFRDDYHGQFDEVLLKGRLSGDPTALPGAPGVPRASVANMVVLGYGAPEALDWLRANGDEIAAVLVEPIQSRRPELRPRAFVEEVRRLTTACGAALILDEVVTGFRVARGGVRELWGVKSDMTTYGKIIGGGMPIGMLAGDATYMDALDGGHWRYGDESIPETAPTFFAGTFVRHPLTLAAAAAVLDLLESDQGGELYDRVAPRTMQLLEEINGVLGARGLPAVMEGYSSWIEPGMWRLDPYASLIYPIMRLNGVHCLDGYAWFFTTAHQEAEFRKVADAFTSSLDRMLDAGFFTDQIDAVARAPEQETAAAATPRPAASRTATLSTATSGPVRVPLTEPQKEVWMAAQLSDEASGVFIEAASLSFDGELDRDALEAALNEAIARHDALRARFSRDGAHMEILPSLTVSLDLQDTDAHGLEAMIEDDARAPFDLVNGPLLRARLARLAPQRHVLILTCHHIICDGWSTGVLIDDLAALYNARMQGEAADLPPAASFAAYAESEASDAPAPQSLDFWRTRLSEPPAQPDLPTDAPRPERRSFHGATHVHEISADRAKALKRAAGRAGATLFAAMSGALAQLIGRLSGAEEVVLASPTAGQTLLPDGQLVGHCVNLLPLRLPAKSKASVGDYLKAVANDTLDAFDHRDVTYGTILRNLDLAGDLNRQPLTEIQFNLDQQPDDFGFAGLRTGLSANPRAFANFDLIFNITESPEGLRIDLTYNTDIFNSDTIKRWCAHYETLLNGFAGDPAAPVDELEIMTPDEARKVAALRNDTATDLPTDETGAPLNVVSLIAAQAAARPDKVCAEDDHSELTYAELARQSDSLAAHIQSKTPHPGARVAVMVERSVALPVALLAVLKAGCAYVPLDPGHPTARLQSILKAAKVDAVLHSGAAPAAAEGVDAALIDLEEGRIGGGAPVVRPQTEDDPTAYVIFTSGSTGKPKGVEICAQAMTNFLTSMARTPGFTEEDAILSVTTVSFDIAALELFLPLIAGGKTVIASTEAVQSGFEIVERLSRGDITVMQATPTLWRMMLEAGFRPSSKLRILTGGEATPRDLADRLLADGAEVWNMYGPTETTIWSACGKIGRGAINIGAPIANTSLHVLDENDRLAPIGVVGELNIGGLGLAKGYFDRPDLTGAAFRPVETPDGRRERLYRTGDLAVRRPDGAIRVLGRRDGQIKLRGFRIELGDIEAAMRGAAGVADAAAALRDGPTGPSIVGYYVPDGSLPAAAPDAIAAHLASRLPAYMVPTRWKEMASLPQTMNAKLDRKRLPDPDPPTAALASATPVRVVEAPDGSLERTIHDIWAEFLGVERVSTTATLFELGVDSLTVFRIAARMLERGLELDARDLFKHPSIRDLAAYAASRAPNESRKAAAPSLSAYRRGARREEARAS
ncbi:MAG: amino acid adenylation domain-containing protein [Pseudomonadota bacterium]